MSALGEAILHGGTCLSSHPRHKMPTAYQPKAQYCRPEGERTPGRLPGATVWAQGSPVHSHTTPKGTQQGRPPTRDRGLLASLSPPLLTNLHLRTCPSPACAQNRPSPRPLPPSSPASALDPISSPPTAERWLLMLAILPRPCVKSLAGPSDALDGARQLRDHARPRGQLQHTSRDPRPRRMVRVLRTCWVQALPCEPLPGGGWTGGPRWDMALAVGWAPQDLAVHQLHALRAGGS